MGVILSYELLKLMMFKDNAVLLADDFSSEGVLSDNFVFFVLHSEKDRSVNNRRVVNLSLHVEFLLGHFRSNESGSLE